MTALYVVAGVGDMALVAATPKTAVSVINAANSLVRTTEISVSFDGVTATAIPVRVELCSSTQAAAGTPGTSPTPTQIHGATRTVQAGGAEDYSVEPTVISVLKTWFMRADGGIFILQNPLGRETEQPVTADAILLRLEAAAAVNARAYIEFEEG